MIPEDLEWLGVDWMKTVIQSDRMETYYESQGSSLRRGGAYVCTCTLRSSGELKNRGEACRCRGPGS